MHKHTSKEKVHIEIINPKQTFIDKHSKTWLRWYNLKKKQMGGCQGRQEKTPLGSQVV